MHINNCLDFFMYQYFLKYNYNIAIDTFLLHDTQLLAMQNPLIKIKTVTKNKSLMIDD
jgi:hypothetical protein